jgi:pimeloyl-ACP methyl ester carboxylesterase
MRSISLMAEAPFDVSTLGAVSLWSLAAVAGAHALLLFVGTLSIVLPNPFRVFRNYGSPRDWGLEAENLTFGGTVPAWLFRHPDSRGMVLVCHGRSRGKAFMLPLVRRLAEHWNVLTFDFPGHGETSYRWTTIGWREADTVGKALDAIESLGFSDIIVYGASQGGAAALREISRHPRASVRALITDGVFADLGEMLLMNARRFRVPGYLVRGAMTIAGWLAGYEPRAFKPVEAIAGIELPTLVMHGDRDPLTLTENAPRLARAGGRHATALIYAGTHDEPSNPNAQRVVVDFIREVSRSDHRSETPSGAPRWAQGGSEFPV